MGLLAFSRQNPFRPVTWRWERAGYGVETAAPPARREDRWVHRAYRYRRAIAAGVEPEDAAELHAHVYWAHQLFLGREDDERRIIPHALEARLLANQPVLEIAESTGYDAEIITAYGRLFFDVDGRLNNSDYIAQAVMGPAVYRGLSGRNFDLLWKLYAWHYGPMFVDLFLQTFADESRPVDRASLMVTMEESAKAGIRFKGMIASKVAPLNEMTVLPIFSEFIKLCEIEKQTAATGGGQQTILGNINAMMQQLPYRVHGAPPPLAVRDRKSITYESATIIETAGGELRGSELMTLALDTGEPVVMSPFVFPPPAATVPINPG